MVAILVLALAVGLGWATATGRLSPKHHPVLVAYALGLGIGASGAVARSPDVFGWPAQLLIVGAMVACVALAIPALLLQTSLVQLRRLGADGLLAGLCVWAGALVAAAASLWVFAKAPPDVALALAIFTGSLANLHAAGLALDVAESRLVAANLGDVAAGGILFVGLTSVGTRLVTGALPRGRVGRQARMVDPEVAAVARPSSLAPRSYATAALASLGSLIAGVLVSIVTAANGAEELVVLGTATLVSIALASTVVTSDVAQASSRLGDGLMIAFCLLVGTSADLRHVAGEAFDWATFMVAFLAVQIAVALALARVLRLDAGVFLLALTGAIYSPAFVAPVAHAAGRRDAIAVGVVWGLVGLALGTPAALAFAAYFPAPN